MKANIKHLDEDDDKIILSIGMIVKNEEKVLERCLKSLQPLMEAIPSELIIADTGSTDSTIEIAKKYTDNVYHFEWINDFSAARNSTLKKARGQWYMYVDADEYLDEDIGEMVHFFKIPELRSKYKSLQINVRSYTDDEKKHYQDGMLARIQRIDDPNEPIEFVGRIHEVMYTRFPLGYFTTILHHTGYCFSSESQSVNKKNRNLALMRDDYKKNPKDIRLLSHLIDGAYYNTDEAEKYISEALELVRKNRRHMYSNVIYMQAILHYEDKKPEYALELCNEYHSSIDNSEKFIATLSILLSEARVLSGLSRYEEAYKVFNRYIQLYGEYKKEKLDLTDASAHPIPGKAEHEYIKNVYMSVLCLVKLKRYDEAFDVMKNIELEELESEGFREFLGTLREICTSKKEYTQLALYYSQINQISFKKNDTEKKSLSLFMMESTFYSLLSNAERQKFAIDVVNSGAEGLYVELMKLYISQNNENFTDDLVRFIDKVDNWDDGYTVAIYLAVKNKIDLSETVEKIKSDLFRTQLELIAENNDDFAGYVVEYGIPENYFSSMKKFYWIVSLYEKASYKCFVLNDDMKYELYNRFVSLLGDYVMNLYNPELLNDDDVETLSNLHKFGYYMYKAQCAINTGDNAGYIREMKNALHNCESMKEIIQFLFEQFKKRL